MPFNPTPSAWIPGMALTSASTIAPCISDFISKISYAYWFHGGTDFATETKFGAIAAQTGRSATLHFLGGRVNGRPISKCVTPSSITVTSSNLVFEETNSGSMAVANYVHFFNELLLYHGLHSTMHVEDSNENEGGYRPRIRIEANTAESFCFVFFEETALIGGSYVVFSIYCHGGIIMDGIQHVSNALVLSNAYSRAQFVVTTTNVLDLHSNYFLNGAPLSPTGYQISVSAPW
jgi:hypothetical protein